MRSSHWRRLAEQQREEGSYDPSISPRSMSVATVDKFTTCNDVAVQQLQREIEELKTVSFDAEATRKEIKELEGRIRNVVEDSQADTHMQRTLREKVLLEIAKAKTKIKNQQKRLAALEAEQKNYALETLNVEAVAKNRQMGFVRSSDLLKDSTLSCNNLRQEAERLRRMAESFNQQKSALQARLTATEDRLEERLGLFRTLKESVVQAEDRLQGLERERASLEDHRQKLEKTNRNSEQRINAVESEINGLLLDVANAGKELQRVKLDAFSAKNEVTIREGKLAKRSTALNEVEDKINDLSSKFAEEKTKLEKKEAFLQHLKVQEEEKLAALDQKRRKTDQLKERLAAMDKVTQKIMEELKNYVKTDKAISDCLQLGYLDRNHGLFPDGTLHRTFSVHSK